MTRTLDFIPRKPVEGQEHGSNNLTLGYLMCGPWTSISQKLVSIADTQPHPDLLNENPILTGPPR